MNKWLILLCIFCFPATFAATTVNWSQAADAICQQITASVAAYQKNDIKNAHLLSIMAYFKHYDADIEPAVRVTLGGPHVFAIEQQFRDLATNMTPNPNADQLKKVSSLAHDLCAAVKADADALKLKSA